MRASEYYAQQIHSFFVGFALDALDRGAPEVAVAEPKPAFLGPDSDYEDEFGNCIGCSCHIDPPCPHCENDHEDCV